MASILLIPCQPWLSRTSFARESPLKKKHKLNNNYHHWNAKEVSCSRNIVRCNNERTFSFNFRSSSSGVPIHEFPWASFDQYMEEKGRVLQAILPEKSTSQQLNEEEWRVEMTPIVALLWRFQPTLHITAKCISIAENYPPEVARHTTKLLEVQITKWELQGLDANLIPPDFNLSGRAILYLEKQGRRNLMKNEFNLNLSLSFASLLVWVPENVLQSIIQSILKNYMEEFNQGFAVRLLADYDSFKRNKKKKQ